MEDPERYIDAYQRRAQRKYWFRGLLPIERIGKLLLDTMAGDVVNARHALQVALLAGDLDAAVEISRALLPPAPAKLTTSRYSSVMSGSFDS